MASSSTTIAANPSPPSPDEQRQLSIPNYLSTVNVASFVSSKLSGDENSNNYFSWRQQFLCLIESRGLLRFIDGRRVLDTVEVPSTTAGDIDELHSIALAEAEFPHYRDNAEWRTDRAVKGWILGSLDDTALIHVSTVIFARIINLTRANNDDSLDLEAVERTFWFDCVRAFNVTTARDIWLELEKKFTPPAQPPDDDVSDYDWSKYLPLYKATLTGDWRKAEEILNSDPVAINARVTSRSQTCLHIAVGTGEAIDFVRNLVDKMFELDERFLKEKDDLGQTALHMAALTGNTEATKILIGRCPDLLCMPDNNGIYPVHMAALFAHRRTLQCLLFAENAPNDDPYLPHSGLELLCILIKANIFDLALHMARTYPILAKMKFVDGSSALQKITLNDSVFSSREINLWDRFIHSVPCSKKILPRKQIMHEQALELVKLLCHEMVSLDLKSASEISADVMFTAARLDVHEVIEEVMAEFPSAIYSRNDSDQYIFHVAVENRSEKVFNLIYQMRNLKHQFLNEVDSSGNTLLHLAGRLAPSRKLNRVSGAALQMQRELQWFQEVEKLLQPYSCEASNKAGKTPRMVFTEEHVQLKTEGEKWMKDTATSFTIVAALVATVVFAAAITVPGGNQSDTGFPLLYSLDTFKLFAVSDAISLFTSVASLLMFLSILTSRYAEQDFLKALPKRLCIGLVSLFISICFMMVAFSATVFMVFGRAEKSWILIPVAVLAFLLVMSFGFLQFPLLWDVVSNTYGRGIFGRQSNRLLS